VWGPISGLPEIKQGKLVNGSKNQDNDNEITARYLNIGATGKFNRSKGIVFMTLATIGVMSL